MKEDKEENPIVEVSHQKMMKGKRKQENTNSQPLSVMPRHLSKKIKYNKLYKPPTPEEINQLNEAETLCQSNFFQLQVDELLAKRKKCEKSKTKLQDWLTTLKTFLMSIPATEKYEIHDLSWFKGIKVPVLLQPKNKRGYFQFIEPSNVFEIGSHILDTSLHPHVIDVAVEMPKACFEKSDYLNHLYHRKRALYLVCLAKALKTSDLIQTMEFTYQNNCHLKPALILKPKGKLGHFSIRLLPYPEPQTFKKARFIPCRNNVRPSWFHQTTEQEQGPEIPTPVYNSSILADLRLPELNLFLKENITSQNIKDGIVLLKVWCMQRGLYGGTGLTGFLANMLAVYLLMKKKVSPVMSSYQVFRSAVLLLKQSILLEQGISLCDNQLKTDNPPLEEFYKAFSVVFLDPSGFLNLFYSMSRESFLMLQHEAELALKILDNESSESFALLFMNKVPFCRKFEYLIHFSQPKKFRSYSVPLKAEQAILDSGGDFMASVAPKLCQLLKSGLGQHVHLVAAEVSTIENWQLEEQPPNPNRVKRVTLGLLVNPDYVFNNLEKGPLADDPKSKEFREFWGKKSELRRFKDGSIHEAVLWPAASIQEKRCVLPQIIKYIFERHANVRPDEVLCIGTELDSVLSLPKELFPEDATPYGTGEELFFSFMQSYDSLTKILRKLDGLPLNITTVQGISAAFRFCEVFPPFPRLYMLEKNTCIPKGDALAIRDDATKSPSWAPAFEMVVHFEGSGKWPDDIKALRRIKAALHVKIAELLKTQHQLTCKVSPLYVDVLKDGYIFRVIVASRKEITLLKQIKTPEGTLQLKENKASRDLKRSTEILPQLNSILHGLHQQHNTFGTACRLAKRWISSHFLSDYIHDIVVELLMAFIFISPEPFTCPSSPQIAFQRFLALLQNHGWESSPLIINFNNEITKEETEEIESTFISQSATLPAMVIIIPLDRSGTMWTRDSPSPLILRRLVDLAKSSLETLELQLYLPQISDFKEIFRPPLAPYAALIYLNTKYVPCQYYGIDAFQNMRIKPFKMYHRRNNEKMPVVQYDPVQYYLKDLREAFDEFALFFYDKYGGDVIAVLQKPNAFESRQFKVSHVNGRMISGVNVDGTLNVVPNVEAMITDFDILGGDLVKTKEIIPEKWIAE